MKILNFVSRLLNIYQQRENKGCPAPRQSNATGYGFAFTVPDFLLTTRLFVNGALS